MVETRTPAGDSTGVDGPSLPAAPGRGGHVIWTTAGAAALCLLGLLLWRPWGTGDTEAERLRRDVDRYLEGIDPQVVGGDPRVLPDGRDVFDRGPAIPPTTVAMRLFVSEWNDDGAGLERWVIEPERPRFRLELAAYRGGGAIPDLDAPQVVRSWSRAEVELWIPLQSEPDRGLRLTWRLGPGGGIAAWTLPER